MYIFLNSNGMTDGIGDGRIIDAMEGRSRLSSRLGPTPMTDELGKCFFLNFSELT